MATMMGTESIRHAGTKRKPALRDIGDQERLVKRFDTLHLATHNSNNINYNIVSSPQSQPATTSPRSGPVSSPNLAASTMMDVDDTPSRIYIHDLDAELAAIEPAESTTKYPIFLSDIERHLSKLPPHLLASRTSPDQIGAPEGQLVLYRHAIPSAITVGSAEYGVRRAVIESRNRARLEQRARLRMERDGIPDGDQGVWGLEGEDRWGDGEEAGRKAFARLGWRDGESWPGEATEEYVVPMPKGVVEVLDEGIEIEEMVEEDPDAMDIG